MLRSQRPHARALCWLRLLPIRPASWTDSRPTDRDGVSNPCCQARHPAHAVMSRTACDQLPDVMALTCPFGAASGGVEAGPRTAAATTLAAFCWSDGMTWLSVSRVSAMVAWPSISLTTLGGHRGPTKSTRPSAGGHGVGSAASQLAWPGGRTGPKASPGLLLCAHPNDGAVKVTNSRGWRLTVSGDALPPCNPAARSW